MKKSLEWWLTLTLEQKFYQVIPWLKAQGRNCTEVHPYDVSEDDIEEMYAIYLDLNFFVQESIDIESYQDDY